jgi:hypothetical protein
MGRLTTAAEEVAQATPAAQTRPPPSWRAAGVSTRTVRRVNGARAATAQTLEEPSVR